MTVTRFGVSLEQDLLESLDEFVQDNSFSNRSQAIRFLIEKNTAERKWLCNRNVAGAVVLVYDSEKNDVASRILEIQQAHASQVLSTQRFFLKSNRCLEVVTVKGEAQELTHFSEELIALKGIRHGKLIMSRAD